MITYQKDLLFVYFINFHYICIYELKKEWILYMHIIIWSNLLCKFVIGFKKSSKFGLNLLQLAKFNIAFRCVTNLSHLFCPSLLVVW
jgi:hypothetical protein